MSLRAAGPDDVPVICALIRALADYEDLTAEVVLDEARVGEELFGPDPAARVTLAEEGGRVVGFALWFWSFSTFLGRRGIWLEDLFVRPEHRGRGVGRELLQHLRSLTDGRIEWNVLDWNEPSIRFYAALGARPVPGWTTYRWLPGDAPPATTAGP